VFDGFGNEAASIPFEPVNRSTNSAASVTVTRSVTLMLSV